MPGPPLCLQGLHASGAPQGRVFEKNSTCYAFTHTVSIGLAALPLALLRAAGRGEFGDTHGRLGGQSARTCRGSE